ncbi:hypothetical protein M405DRAFT_815886 [Rhizopogon salebrosus TDB-379]|nr:hypothetical protein M405DRAFT_815886 [Rhizopogon salebrosus TDB-379]
MTNGITLPSGPDRHCASSSSSQFLPPCTVSILLASFCLSPLPSSFSSASSAHSGSCNIMDSGHTLFLWFMQTVHCISMLLSCCACEGEAWTPEGRLRLHARLDADLVDETGLGPM